MEMVTNMTDETTRRRLEYLRGEIDAERISYGELHELQGLAEHIEPGDVQLLEWAGVPEFPEDDAELIDVIQAIANVIEADTTLRVDAGGEGVFQAVDSIDVASGTLIFLAWDGRPYEVRVRRVTEADCLIDKDGVIPDAITPRKDEA